MKFQLEMLLVRGSQKYYLIERTCWYLNIFWYQSMLYFYDMSCCFGNTSICPNDISSLNFIFKSFVIYGFFSTNYWNILPKFKMNAPVFQETWNTCFQCKHFYLQGMLLHPYLSLQFYDILSEINIRGFIVGASNILYKQRKHLVDVVIDVSIFNVKIMSDFLSIYRILYIFFVSSLYII